MAGRRTSRIRMAYEQRESIATSGSTARGNDAFMIRLRPLSTERAPVCIALLTKVKKKTAQTTNLLIGVLVPTWGLFDALLEPAVAAVFFPLRLIALAAAVVSAWYIYRSEDLERNRIATFIHWRSRAR